MKTVKLTATLILIYSGLFLHAQDIEVNRSIMNRIMLDTEHYQYATAIADSFDIAIRQAVSLLAGQIMTKVQSETIVTEEEKDINGEISSATIFTNINKTFTDVRLIDYHVLMVGKPTKKKKNYEAFVYISSGKVEEILNEIKQAEIEAAHERERQLKSDVQFYYDEGLRALEDIRIGDALKCFYWGYLLSSGTNVELERKKTMQPADALFSTLLDQTLSNINVLCEGQKTERINEYQSLYVKKLGFYYTDSSHVYHRITCLDFKYNDGNTFVDGPRVRDGISVAELRYNLDKTYVHCIYNYDSSETPQQLQEKVKNKKSKIYPSAEKLVEFDTEYIEEPVTNPASAPLVDYNTASQKQCIDSARIETLTAMMLSLETGIRNKIYGDIANYFTEDGYECFNKLIRYGNASIIGQPRYEFVTFGDLIICRSITMQFRFRNNKKFVENVVFRFNKDNQIESLAFALTDVAQHDIMDNKDWSPESKLTLLSFMEDYQTAYALGRIEYLERIFSENALIISGYKVFNKVSSDGIKLHGYTHYDTMSKSQYMAKLRKHFKTKEYINLNFTETDFNEAGGIKDFFGIRVRQEYFSSNYGDVGYLFLLVDLREEVPVIHVRAWQDDKLPAEQLFSLKDVY